MIKYSAVPDFNYPIQETLMDNYSFAPFSINFIRQIWELSLLFIIQIPMFYYQACIVLDIFYTSLEKSPYFPCGIGHLIF